MYDQRQAHVAESSTADFESPTAQFQTVSPPAFSLGDDSGERGESDDFLANTGSSKNAMQRSRAGALNSTTQAALATQKGPVIEQKANALINQGKGGAPIQAKFALNDGAKPKMYDSAAKVDADKAHLEKLCEENLKTDLLTDRVLEAINELAEISLDKGILSPKELFDLAVKVSDVNAQNEICSSFPRGLEPNKDEYLEPYKDLMVHYDRILEFFDSDEDVTFIKKRRESSKKHGRTMMLALKNFRDKTGDITNNLEFLKDSRRKIGQDRTYLNRYFPLNEGGFSAKSRAHVMDTRDTATAGYTRDDSYLTGVNLDGASLGKQIHKKNTSVDEKSSAGVVPGWLAADFKKGDYNSTISKYERQLQPLSNGNTFNWAACPPAKDRDGGQAKNMKGVNASAYAEMAGVAGYKGKRWEWLHLRASSLGGATDSTNLVVGTRDANTHMMPFEANIRLLAKKASEDPRYKHLEVNFSAIGVDAKARHKAQNIKINWKLEKEATAAPGTKDLEGEATFNPLSTGSSISKKEIEIIETALKGKRNGLN